MGWPLLALSPGHTSHPQALAGPSQHSLLQIENLLLSNQGTVKLCDFGSATTVSHYPDYSWSAQKRALVEEEVSPGLVGIQGQAQAKLHPVCPSMNMSFEARPSSTPLSSALWLPRGSVMWGRHSLNS